MNPERTADNFHKKWRQHALQEDGSFCLLLSDQILTLVAAFNGADEGILRHDLRELLRGIFPVCVKGRVVYRLPTLALDDETIEAVSLKKFLDVVIRRPVAHEADLHLKILLRLKKLALDMEDALHADEDDGRARGDDVHPRARSHAHARRRPYARGGRKSMDLMLAVDNDGKRLPRSNLRNRT